MSKSSVYIKKLVLVALFGASLNAVKFCLMYIPNVEAVTLLIVVYTYCFGLGVGLPATLVFCTIEGFLFGFNPSWLVAYYIHWPFIAIVTHFIKKLKIKNSVLIAIIIGTATALFGLQSTFTYFLTGGAVGKAGWVERYFVQYASGWAFYVTQVVCNLVLISIAFTPLTRLLDRLGRAYFGTNTRQNPLSDKDK